MAFPPQIPPLRSDIDPQLANHPGDHNLIAQALSELVDRATASPQNGCALTFSGGQNTGTTKGRVSWGAGAPTSWNAAEWRDPNDATRVLVPESGRFRILCQLAYTNLAAGAVARVFINCTGPGNVLEAVGGSGTAPGGGNLTVHGVTYQALSAGNAITIDSMSSDDGSLVPLQSWLEVMRLGD